MSDETRPLDGLSLLEQLCPPPGYRTTWAFGTTYSLDLVSAVAALTALDGRTRDTTGYTLPSALRALANLRSRVRIFAQQGCISPSPKANPRVLALLDSVVRPIEFDLSKKSFHPKVWVVRQDPSSSEDGPSRFLLVVGSRNLTRDTSWDLGIAVEGQPGEGTNLNGVGAFMEHVCALGGEAKFAAPQMSALSRVQWTTWPKGMKSLRFAWSRGDGKGFSTENGHFLSLPVGQRLLVLTPFLDEGSLSRLAKRWADLPKKNKLLLSGLDSLRRLSEKASSDVASLQTTWIGVAREEPADTSQEEEGEPLDEEGNSDQLEQDRGLHAKVIAVWHGKRATILLGSPNLTKRAWDGHNCEAWVIAECSSEVIDALRKWAEDRANPLNETSQSAPGEDDEAVVLKELHHALSARRFQLDEQEADAPVLRCEPPLPHDELRGLRLHVARISTPDRRVEWTGLRSTSMPPCEVSERTRFVWMRLAGDTRAKTWIQTVDVTPAIESIRDATALRQLLKPEQFLRYLWSCLGDPLFDGDGESADDVPASDSAGGRSARPGRGERPLRLETLLHAISRARKAGQKGTLREIDNLIREYRSDSRAKGPARLEELFVAWDAIREVMLP